MILSRRAAAVFIAASLAGCGMAPPTATAQQPKAASELSDTVKALIENGATMTFGGGLTTNLIYNTDGTLGGDLGDLGGTWKAEGAQVCVNVPGYAENQCLTYPAGKKSGDRFDIPTKSAPITIAIN